MKIEQAQFCSSIQVAGMLHDYLADVDREHFVVLMLDRKNRLIGINTVSIGSLTASVVHPRGNLETCHSEQRRGRYFRPQPS